MPVAQWGQKVKTGNSKFLKLESKGESAIIRLLGPAVYEGMHFIKDDAGNFQRSYCPRIMGEMDCMYCNKYFELTAKVKEAKSDKKKEELKKSADQFRSSIKFYYPVLDRTELYGGQGEGEAKIFETRTMVRVAIENAYKGFVETLGEEKAIERMTESDWIVTRTEQTGAGNNYYSVQRMDSSDVADLTEEEQNQLNIGRAFDLEEELGHTTLDSNFNPVGKSDEPY